MNFFYGPGDWLVARFTRRQRCAFAAWVMILSIFPGIPIWYALRHSLGFIGFLSIVALTLSMWGVVSAETPVEHEGGDT